MRMLLAAAALAVLPGLAGAATVTYSLTGSEIRSCTLPVTPAGPQGSCDGVEQLTLDGLITINERILGRSLKGADFSITTVRSPDDPLSDPGSNAISFTNDILLGSFFEPTIFSEIALRLDEYRNPLGWGLQADYDPPSFFASVNRFGGGESIFEVATLSGTESDFGTAVEIFLQGTPGTLKLVSVAPIPVPAAGTLLLGGLAVFGLLRRRAGRA